MKVTIQTLKAPWPTGAKVGDVVAFEGDTAPAWAVGKFAPAPDNAEAEFHYEPKAVTGDGSGEARSLAIAEEARARASMDEVEGHARHVAALERERDQALQQRDSAQSDLAAALDREAALQQQLDAVQAKPEAKTREDLNAEAEKLGVKVDGRWSDERLVEEIAKAAKK